MGKEWREKLVTTQLRVKQWRPKHRQIRLLPMMGLFYLCVLLLAQFPVATGIDILMLLGLIAYIAIMMFVVAPRYGGIKDGVIG